MFARLIARGEALAKARRAEAVERLSEAPVPAGISVEATEQGVVLSGQRLRRRLIDDVRLRRFGR